MGSLEQSPSHTGLPERLGKAFSLPPALSDEQCGHIRHIHNLVSQPDGDWAFMGSQENGQEYDMAYRYQLAHMAYAIGAAHYHHMPAQRSALKSLFEKLIRKMMDRAVWEYWYMTSQSGIRVDPDLKELRKPWVDPVCKENIMYSGHLLCMISLYTMLFHDHRYDEKDSIFFDWNPVFFGMGRETYSYTRLSLQEAILRQMESENWKGVCCEPNMVFIVCNQFPILSFRYNDTVDGTHTIDNVLEKYQAAWADKGFVAENGLFHRNWYPKQKRYGTAEDIGHTTWALAFMPWNYEQTEPLYPSIANGFLENIDGRTNIRPRTVAQAIRRVVAAEGGSHDDPSIVERARESVKDQPPSTNRFYAPVFAHVAYWVSEYGSQSDLDSLLRHADTFFRPSWHEGGLYYKRSDSGWDENGNYTYVEPLTGNAAIAYARLNVRHGQKKMWDEPWTKEQVEGRPWIDGVHLDQGVDSLRGFWDEKTKTVIATYRSWDGSNVTIKPVIKALPIGRYGVYVDGDLRDVAEIHDSSDEVVVDLNVGQKDVNLVVIGASDTTTTSRKAAHANRRGALYNASL